MGQRQSPLPGSQVQLQSMLHITHMAPSWCAHGGISYVSVCLFVVYVGVRGVSNAHVSLQLRRSRVVRLLCLQHRHSLVITLWLSTGASTLHCDAIQPRSFVHDHAQLHFHNCCAAMLYSMFRLRCQAFSRRVVPMPALVPYRSLPVRNAPGGQLLGLIASKTLQGSECLLVGSDTPSCWKQPSSPMCVHPIQQFH